MSEVAEIYQGMKSFKAKLRERHGVPCPECQRLLPKAHPKILLPGHYCRMHKYTDRRPELTQEDYDAVSGGEA
jgi:hypothetical protein